MAYDENFQALPRFTPEEVGSGVSIPELYLGQLRKLDGVLRLSKVKTSPTIEKFIASREGEVTPRVAHNFLKNGEKHTVAWVGRVGLGYNLICDCIDGYEGDLEGFEESTFYCEAIVKAINFNATQIGRRLNNEALLHEHGDRPVITSMINFMLQYASSHPDVWFANHKSGVALVGAVAKATERTYEETAEVVQEMENIGDIVTSGIGGQVIEISPIRRQTLEHAA